MNFILTKLTSSHFLNIIIRLALFFFYFSFFFFSEQIRRKTNLQRTPKQTVEKRERWLQVCVHADRHCDVHGNNCSGVDGWVGNVIVMVNNLLQIELS